LIHKVFRRVKSPSRVRIPLYSAIENKAFPASSGLGTALTARAAGKDYQANTESPVFPDLRGLLAKTVGLVDVLADALKPSGGKLRLVFVYGSIASGQERSDSDIELMVIGAVPPADLALPLRKAREILGREINPTVYSSAEFDSKRALLYVCGAGGG
jgi:predicted nucleotidyltransferase